MRTSLGIVQPQTVSANAFPWRVHCPRSGCFTTSSISEWGYVFHIACQSSQVPKFHTRVRYTLWGVAEPATQVRLLRIDNQYSKKCTHSPRETTLKLKYDKYLLAPIFGLFKTKFKYTCS